MGRTVRLWGKVDVRDVDECWPFLGAVLNSGYGSCQPTTAHRVAYQLTHGAIPAGLEVDHLCHTKLCCNPAHLEAVTKHENRRRQATHNARTCELDNCGRKHYGRGLCREHWAAQYRERHREEAACA